MPERNTSKGTSKSAAARGEAKQQPKSADFRGVTLTLPPELPGELIFDLAALDRATGPGPIVELLETLLGVEQVRQVRAKVAEEKVPFSAVDGVLLGLISDIVDAYGTSTGESSASQDS